MQARLFILAAVLLSGGCRIQDVETPDSINISVPYELDSLDPHARYRIGDFAVASHFYEPLVRADPESKLQPCLARTWESPDPQTWIFNLTPSARFHSGKSLSSQDVVYSIRRLMRDPSLRIRAMISSVSDVSAVGPLRVRIRLERPLSTFLSKLILVLIVPAGATAEELSQREDGTGPYRLVKWVRGQQVQMLRNAEYWGRRPALRRAVLYLGRSPEQARSDLLLGQSHFVQSNDKRLRQSVAWKGDYRVQEHDSLLVMYLGFDMARDQTPYCSASSNPFRHKLVRQAIHVAVDRSRLVDALKSWATPATQPVPHFVFGFNPGIRAADHDPERARWLLRMAGYPEEGFSVVLHTRRILEPAARQIQAQLAPVGIRVDVRPLPDPEFFDAVARGDVSFYLSRFGCITGDASDMLEDCLHTPDPVGRYGGSNYGRYSDPVLDAAIEGSSWITDRYTRRRELEGIMADVMEDLPWLPLYVEREVYAFQSVLRWRPRNDSSVLAQEIALASP